MNQNTYFQHFQAAWDRLDSWHTAWQVGALLLCLGLAALIARRIHRHAEQSAEAANTPQALRFGKAGLVRVAFPFAAVLLVFVARAVLKPWMPVDVLNIAVPLMMSMAAVRMAVYVLRTAFPTAVWLTTSEKVVSSMVWTVVALYLTGLAAPVVSALEGVQFTLGKDAVDLWMVLRGVFMVVVTILIALWMAGLVERRLAVANIDTSLQVVLSRITKAVMTLIAVLISLSMVGIDLTALSVFGGALGVGLGFGLQKIASNYVSGFIILLDRSIRLGDFISLDAQTQGLVTQITTRYTVVRMLSGTEVLVPNEHMVGNIVLNQSYTDRRVRVGCKVQVAYGTELDDLFLAMAELAAKHPRVIADPAPKVSLLGFADSGMDIELGFWIQDPEEGMNNVRSDLNRDILKLFRERGVEIPFPQREVRVLNPQGGGVLA